MCTLIIIAIIMLGILFVYQYMKKKTIKGWWMLDAADMDKYSLKMLSLVILDYRYNTYFGAVYMVDNDDTVLYSGPIVVVNSMIFASGNYKGDKKYITGKLDISSTSLKLTTNYIYGELHQSKILSRIIL